MAATSWRSRLRAAGHQGDGAAVIALAHLTPEARLEGDDAPAWQLLGDGLIIALTDHRHDSLTAPRDCPRLGAGQLPS